MHTHTQRKIITTRKKITVIHFRLEQSGVASGDVAAIVAALFINIKMKTYGQKTQYIIRAPPTKKKKLNT